MDGHLDHHTRNLKGGKNRLAPNLGPLACPKPLPHGEIPSSENLPASFQEAYRLSAQRGEPASGFTFNPPVLSQLNCMLPEGIVSGGISISLSAKADTFHDSNDLSRHIAQSPAAIAKMIFNTKSLELGQTSSFCE